jgi:hypothetical protein
MTCNYNLAEQGLERSRYFDYVSTRALEAAEVRDGQIILSGKAYRRLVLPYASMISKAIWLKLQACLDSGVDLVFVGPPPSRLWDTGEEIATEFSRRVGIVRVDAAQYDAVLTSQRPVPALSDWEPDKADFRFPVTAELGTEVLTDFEGDTVGVRRANLTWLTTLDPRETFYNHVPTYVEGVPAVSHYGNGYYRWYAGKEADQAVLVCIAPLYETLHEFFESGECRFRLEGGAWAVLSVSGKDVSMLLADEATSFESTGTVQS